MQQSNITHTSRQDSVQLYFYNNKKKQVIIDTISTCQKYGSHQDLQFLFQIFFVYCLYIEMQIFP
jgi:hypothetical protein